MSWLEQAFWNSFTEETAMGWDETNPAWGHSEVASLVVQDYLGGDIKQGHVIAEGVVLDIHCWNRTKHNIEVDFTAASLDYAYGMNNWYLKHIKNVDREELFKHQAIAIKYRIFSTRVSGFLQWKSQYEGRVKEEEWKL